MGNTAPPTHHPHAKAQGAALKGGRAAPQTHVFTLAMLTRKLVPPPEATGDRAVGETRTAKRGAVSVKFGPALTDEAARALLPPGGGTKDQQRGAFTALAESQVRAHYGELVADEAARLGGRSP